MNPVEEYLQSKTAAGIMSKIPRPDPESTKRLVGAAGLFLAGMGAGKAVDKAYYAITKKRDFDSMMEANPDLAEYQTDDPKRFAQHYTSLRNMNPRFAAEPVVAGTYMRQMSQSPQTAGKVIVESLKGVPAGTSEKAVSTGMGYAAGLFPTETERLKQEQMRQSLED